MRKLLEKQSKKKDEVKVCIVVPHIHNYIHSEIANDGEESGGNILPTLCQFSDLLLNVLCSRS